MLRDVRYKYCLYDQYANRESLVDMLDDPGETRNVAADPAFREALHGCRRKLREFCADTDDPFATNIPA
jgi:hypothetical protein